MEVHNNWLLGTQKHGSTQEIGMLDPNKKSSTKELLLRNYIIMLDPNGSTLCLSGC